MTTQHDAQKQAITYMKHKTLCAFVGGYGEICTCGRDEAAAALSQQAEQEPRPVAQEQSEECGCCGGSGWMVRDPDIGTDQECFACDGTGKLGEDGLAHKGAQEGEKENG